MTTYQKLRDIVHLVNLPNVALNGSVDIDVDFLNSVSVMVEELKESLEQIQKLRPGKYSIQNSVESFLIANAIDRSDFVSEKYWPKDN